MLPTVSTKDSPRGDPPHAEQDFEALAAEVSASVSVDGSAQDEGLPTRRQPEDVAIATFLSDVPGFLVTVPGMLAAELCILEGKEAVVDGIYAEMQNELWGPRVQNAKAVAGALLNVLASAARGGVLLVQAPSHVLQAHHQMIAGEATDDGYLEKRMVEENILHVFDDRQKPPVSAKFSSLLEEFSMHEEGDRWPDDYKDVRARGKPKDGGWVVSATGNIRCAARRFFPPQKAWYSWPSVGMRHTTAFSVACALECCIVFVVSDSKCLHIITSGGARVGVVFTASLDSLANVQIDFDEEELGPGSFRPGGVPEPVDEERAASAPGLV